MWQLDKDLAVLNWVNRNNRQYSIPFHMAKREIKKAKYRSDIQDAADQAGIIIKVLREIRSLEDRLDKDERVYSMTPATHNDERGLLVATNRRLMFIFDGWLNKSYITYDYKMITEARWFSGFIMGRMKISLYGSENRIKFTQIWKPVGKPFAKLITDKSSHFSDMTRKQHEVNVITSTFTAREYQVRKNDLIADRLALLEKEFALELISREDYVNQKLMLLRSMS